MNLLWTPYNLAHILAGAGDSAADSRVPGSPEEGRGIGFVQTQWQPRGTAFERSGNTLKRYKRFYLEAKARMWPWLSYLCHIRSKAADSASPLGNPPKTSRAPSGQATGVPRS